MKPPEILYKYTAAPTAKIILETGRIRWSSPSVFNDLAEFQRMPVFDPPIQDSLPLFLKKIIDIAFSDQAQHVEKYSEITKLLINLISIMSKSGKSKSAVFDELNANSPFDQNHISKVLREHTQQQKYISTARVCCLSSSFDNDVMWAHYALNHMGCVLGFRHIEELDTPFRAAKQVKYTKGNPVVYDGVEFLLYGDTPGLRQKVLEGICYTKDPKWSYEEEWRVVTWRNDTDNDTYSEFLFYKEELESITFGLNIDVALMNQIIKEKNIKYTDCKTYKMTHEFGELRRINIG